MGCSDLHHRGGVGSGSTPSVSSRAHSGSINCSFFFGLFDVPSCSIRCTPCSSPILVGTMRTTRTCRLPNRGPCWPRTFTKPKPKYQQQPFKRFDRRLVKEEGRKKGRKKEKCRAKKSKSVALLSSFERTRWCAPSLIISVRRRSTFSVDGLMHKWIATYSASLNRRKTSWCAGLCR